MLSGAPMRVKRPELARDLAPVAHLQLYRAAGSESFRQGDDGLFQRSGMVDVGGVTLRDVGNWLVSV